MIMMDLNLAMAATSLPAAAAPWSNLFDSIFDCGLWGTLPTNLLVKINFVTHVLAIIK